MDGLIDDFSNNSLTFTFYVLCMLYPVDLVIVILCAKNLQIKNIFDIKN